MHDRSAKRAPESSVGWVEAFWAETHHVANADKAMGFAGLNHPTVALKLPKGAPRLSSE